MTTQANNTPYVESVTALLDNVNSLLGTLLDDVKSYTDIQLGTALSNLKMAEDRIRELYETCDNTVGTPASTEDLEASRELLRNALDEVSGLHAKFLAEFNVRSAKLGYVEKRNTFLQQSTANQGESLKKALAMFVHAFPTLAEVSEIVTSNGGMKTTKADKIQETRYTTMVLYIVQAGEDTFTSLWNSVKVDDKLTEREADERRASSVLTIYNAMILVDKHSRHIAETSKFIRKA